VFKLITVVDMHHVIAVNFWSQRPSRLWTYTVRV